MRQSIKVSRYFDKKVRGEGENRFDNLPKHLRTALIYDPGELDFRRILLSSDPRLREKLKTLGNVVEKLRIKFPEIIGVTIHGSHVKGYSNSESDIDATIFIDEDKIRHFENKQDAETFVNNLPRYLQIKDDINFEISNAGLEKESRGIYIFPISKGTISKFCNGEFVPTSTIVTIMSLFNVTSGKGIYEYREFLISTLETKENGDAIWRGLMSELFQLENMTLDPKFREKITNPYPKTLAEGRKYFIGRFPWRPEKPKATGV